MARRSPEVRRLPTVASLTLLAWGCVTGAPALPSSTVPPSDPGAPSLPPGTTARPARPGGLDPTFGSSGTVVVDMGGSDDSIRGVAVDAMGNLTVVGEARRDASSVRTFALVRLLADGSVDETFGDAGRVHTGFGDFQGSGAHAVAIQPDGRLVVVGFGRHPEVFHDTFAIARYEPDGSLDASFAGGGGTLTAIDAQTGAGRNDIAHAVAVDAEGRIVVAGETGALFKDFAIARYLPDGSLDASFGTGGIVVTDLGGDDRANAVAVQPDGGILVAGSGWRTSGAGEFALVRYGPDGTLDATVGDGGIVVTDFRGGSDRAQGVSVGPDGTILLGGVVQLSGGCSPNPCERYGLGGARYTADGTLDPTFGDGGLVHPDLITSSGGYATARVADGPVALAGHIGDEDFGLMFLGAGGLVPIEGGDALRIDFGGSDRAFAAAPGPGGMVVLAGDTRGFDGSTDVAVARYVAPTAP